MKNLRFPDFIIAGATRSGTSTLFTMLSAHPEVFMPARKELQFFFIDRDFSKGMENYAAHFSSVPAEQICGEASPLYFEKALRQDMSGKIIHDERDDCAIRICKEIPKVKIVISLRSPIKRAYSEYWKNVWQGRETAKSFEQAIDEELSGKRDFKNTPFLWLYRNHYKTHIEHWLSVFPREQVHLMILEEWGKGLHGGLKSLEVFLGLKSVISPQIEVQKTNSSRVLYHPALQPLAQVTSSVRALNRLISRKADYPPLSPITEGRLKGIFEEDITYLGKVLGRPIEVW